MFLKKIIKIKTAFVIGLCKNLRLLTRFLPRGAAGTGHVAGGGVAGPHGHAPRLPAYETATEATTL